MNFLKPSILLTVFLAACTPTSELFDSTGVSNINRSVRVDPEITTIINPRIERQPEAEVAYMKAKLNALQARSISENREYCGLLAVDTSGNYSITPPTRGTEASCRPSTPARNLHIIASYHTHAAYSPRYDGEVPSATDLEGDITDRINGYVSTPGGRLWFVDNAAREVVLICGLSCLTSDPRFQSDPGLPVFSRYTLAGLQSRQ